MGVQKLWPVLEAAAHTLPLPLICANRLVTSQIASDSGFDASQFDHEEDTSGFGSLTPSSIHSTRQLPLPDLSAFNSNDDVSIAASTVKSLFPVQHKGLGYHPLKVAVDASIWMMASPYQHTSTKDLTLSNIYYKLMKLLNFGILPVFVFDKRNHDEFNMYGESARQLLGILNIPSFVAATNAEAECARLNSLGIVDAVMSDDGDSFLYGANMIIRNWGRKHQDPSGSTPAFNRKHQRNIEADNDGDEVEPAASSSKTKYVPKRLRTHKFASHGVEQNEVLDVYTANEIDDLAGLNRDSLVLTALLSGAKDTEGASSIGIKTAAGLSRLFGPVIIPAVLKGDHQQTRRAVAQMKEVLRTKSFKHIERANSKGADQIPDMWPDIHDVKTYFGPTLTLDRDPNLVRVIEESFAMWHPLSISKDTVQIDFEVLIRWMQAKLDWSRELAITKIMGTLGRVLRLRRLRLEAHEAARKGDVDLKVSEFERMYRDEAMHATMTPKSRRHAKSPGSAQSNKLTNYFTAIKTPTSLRKSSSSSLSEKEGGGQRTSAPVGASSAAGSSRSQVTSDSTLVEQVTMAKSVLGITQLRVKWSKDGQFPGIPNNIIEAHVAVQKLKSANKLSQDSAATFDGSADDIFGDTSMESDRDWVEASFIKAATPQMYAKFNVKSAAKGATAQHTSSSKTNTSVRKRKLADTVPTDKQTLQRQAIIDEADNLFGDSTPTQRRKITVDPDDEFALAAGKQQLFSVGNSLKTQGVPASNLRATPSTPPRPQTSNTQMGLFDSDDEPSESIRSHKSKSLAHHPPAAPRKAKAFMTLDEMAWKERPSSPTSRQMRF